MESWPVRWCCCGLSDLRPRFYVILRVNSLSGPPCAPRLVPTGGSLESWPVWIQFPIRSHQSRKPKLILQERESLSLIQWQRRTKWIPWMGWAKSYPRRAYVLSWNLDPESEEFAEVTVLALRRREAGVLLAVPAGFLPAASNQCSQGVEKIRDLVHQSPSKPQQCSQTPG